MMLVSFVFYFAFNQLLEYLNAHPGWREKFARGPVQGADDLRARNVAEDEDVRAEEERLRAHPSAFTVRVEGLRKVFKQKSSGGACNCCGPVYKRKDDRVTAVRNLWFGVEPGQCFGFLGVNGAGKTTSLQMLSGHFFPDAGEAFLGQYSVLYEQNALRRKLGYCPQFEPLYELLTGREHVELAAKIKGVLPEHLKAVVEKMLSDLNLLEFADKPAGGYSGGNKRKLTVACALTGSPPIVFLDEPSTGMDPYSRRFMWNYISQTMQGRSVILTTHSMEEAEALCTRIGIMAEGELKCIGTPRHLKNKFGQGVQLDFTIALDQAEAGQNALVQFVKETFSGEASSVAVLSHVDNQFKFHVKPTKKKEQATSSKSSTEATGISLAKV